MGSCSVVQCVSHLMGQPLYCSAVDAGLWGKREAVVMAPPLHVTQQYHLASMAARLFSTGISYHSLLPLIPLISLSTVNSSPCPGIAPQTLNSSSQLLHLLGDLLPCPGYIWLWQELLILIVFRLPQISCFTLSLKYFSSDSDNCLIWGLDPCFSSPSRRGQVPSY